MRVLGPEFDSFLADEEPLDRGLLIEQRDHDVAVFRHRLFPDDDQVLIPDASACPTPREGDVAGTD